MTVADFLLARIAEDEEAAAFPRPEVATLSARLLTQESSVVRLAHPPRPGLAGAMEEGARALTHHHPARVRAEARAKRRIVEGVEHSYLGYSALLILAAIYADHPDYRDEWKP